jgi:N-methylhydantoinase A
LAERLEDDKMTARLAVDIGGTFTDIVLATGDGRLLLEKIRSTTHQPEAAVIEGTARVLAAAGITGDAVAEVLHGTTVASNTILQREGARTGLITTRGFRDVLEIGRVRTPELYDIMWDKPAPLVRRRHRLEVAERVMADGSVLEPLDEPGVIEAADWLVAEGIEALAICFINSHRNPAHERRALELIAERHRTLALSASVDILPQVKEYERTSTTVVNAYVLPVMRRYLDRLGEGLAGLGVTCPLLITASSGGAASFREAARRPVFFIGSGPAAGVIGAVRAAAASGIVDAIAFDMGGTTAKSALIEAGEVVRTQEYEFRDGISTPSRFIKAGGYLLKVPAIDIAEVGAGAGSIAHVDEAGLLHVGPRSAGGDPGPAAYAQGGSEPTVADANIVLGFLNPAGLVGGGLALRPDLARAAIERAVAQPLGLAIEAAAMGIRALANANMVRAIRAVTVERGVDPRDFTLVAFGGSGPVHACDLAEALGVTRVLVPPMPGIFTAVGMLAADVELPFVTAFTGPLEAIAGAEAQARLTALRAEATRALAAEGFTGDAALIEPAIDLRYEGQDSELTLALDADPATLEARFRAEYDRLFAYASHEPLEIVNLRVTARGRRAARRDPGAGIAPTKATATGERPVAFDPASPTTTPVIDRSALPAAFAGPLIVESYDSTIVVPPGWHGSVDAAGSILLERA